ncbi:unnamed protein product [Nippostrongylus brasiliensis]|uniref:FH2 domain-containing protein n=1 Tax=Nippostrongylus brasiliensis TaxID=27835 RepID=A0A0N4XK91_NIPBR|nr:unnamed protein product [Nippostrongylus brasiliensis]
MWVESTSAACPSDDEKRSLPKEESDDDTIPQVRVFECSEKSVSASPPGNTTTSTTGGDDEPSHSVQIQINDELLPSGHQKTMNRLDSLATSEMSETQSVVSSDIDKISLLKLRFKSNLQKAREDAKKEVDFVASSAFILNPIEHLLNDVDRFLKRLKPQNFHELEAIIKETWSAIPVERCMKFFDSM